MSERVQSIERAIDVLFALVDGPRTLAQVTRSTGLSKGTAFRILGSLAYENVVVKSDENMYSLGPGCLRLLQGALGGFGAISAVGRRQLTELWEKTGETVSVHVRLGVERVCVEELPSTAPVRYISTVGSTAPLHVGSAGRVLLAFSAEDGLERMIQEVRAAGHRINATALRRELKSIRENGYAMSLGERVHGAAAISVPVFGRNEFLASLSVLGPEVRMTEERRLSFLPVMRSTAAAIERTLNHDGASSERHMKAASA